MFWHKLSELLDLLLLRLNKKYKVDIKYTFSGGFWVLLKFIASSLTGIILTLLFANFFAPEEYGLYKYILSIESIFLISTLSGLNTSTTQSIANGFDNTLRTAFKKKLQYGYLGSAILLIFSTYYFLQNNPILAIAFLFIAIFSPLEGAGIIYESFFQGKKKFKTLTFLHTTYRLLLFAGITASIFLSEKAIIPIIVYLLINAFVNIFFYFRTTRLISTKKSQPESIKTGFHLSFANSIETIGKYIDQVLLFHYLGPGSLAIYNFAIIIPIQLFTISNQISVIALPKMSTQESSQIKKKLPSLSLIFFTLMTIVCFMYIFLAPFLFKIFLPQYIHAVFFSQVFALIIPVANGLQTSALLSQNAIKENYILKVGTGILRILLLFYAIYNYGLWGAIIAKVVINYIYYILSLFLIKKMK